MIADAEPDEHDDRALERRLARLLRAGTSAALAITSAGILLALAGVTAAVMTAGIAAFIALPLARLLVMTRWFAGAGERRMALVSAIVLATVVAGAVYGSLTPGAGG